MVLRSQCGGWSMAGQAIPKDEVGLMQVLPGLLGTVDRTSPSFRCQCPGQATARLLWQSLSFARFQGVPHEALLECIDKLTLAP